MRQAEGMSEHTEQNANEDPREFWEQLYAGAAPIWSGRVNRTLAEIVADLPPGRSLDLGCGEGGDVLWLAERGWHATGIDLSETAVQRAREAARERNGTVDDAGDSAVDSPIDGSVEGSANGAGTAVFLAADLADWVKTGGEVDGNPGSFDLITASFLQSPVALPRELILRAALARLAPGGRLVLISHAAPPPWAAGSDSASGHDHGSGHGDDHSDEHSDGHRHGSGGPKFFSPDDELEMLGLARLDSIADSGADVENTEVADLALDRGLVESAGVNDDAENISGSPNAEYVVRVAEIRKREVNDPDGRPAHIDDSLVIVQRAGGAGRIKTFE